jgi:predicted nucleotidyltransferase
VRNIPDSFDPAVVSEIDQELTAVALDHGVTVPIAIESGSRAWGFPSPDSDYDCRFVFVRPLEHYLSPWPARDVIESAPRGLLDVNGWDLQKAIHLLVKGNAVILEWMRSPIVYQGDQDFVSAFLVLADDVAHRGLIASHYLHVGQAQWERFVQDERAVPLKRLFYSLRPAMALRWLRQHPDSVVPPMSLQDLVAQTELPGDAAAAIDSLVALKAVTREMGTSQVPRGLRSFILGELEDVDWLSTERSEQDTQAARRRAAGYFRQAVSTYGPRP